MLKTLLILFALLAMSILVLPRLRARRSLRRPKGHRDVSLPAEGGGAPQDTEMLLAAFQGMQELILAVDRGGSVMLVNPAFEQAFGVGVNQALGRNVLEVVRDHPLNKLLQRCIHEESPQKDILQMGARVFEARVVPLEKGHATRALAVLHDITELQRLERIRRDFVTNVSHELRTPLGAITGYAETLLDGAADDPGERDEFLRVIHENAQRLGALVNDLLDLARIETPVAWPSQSVPLHRLIEETLAVFRGSLQRKKIRTTADISPDIVVRVDENRTKQVLSNLVDNAIKFTPEGGWIRLAASHHNGAVQVAVSDNGEGIPAEDHARVFERFYRVRKDRPRAQAGTGLGLAIARHIVEKMGGSIAVESELEKGSTFRFMLPKG